MARRTKEEALETRHQILDAAERLFERQGVSRTSLQAIAAEAGITRGAIYWHFKDKADLFNAMMERIMWPIERDYLYREDMAEDCAAYDPIASLRRVMLECLNIITHDTQVQRLLGICHYQTEYTEEMAAVKERMLEAHGAFYARHLAAFQHPRIAAALRPGIRPEIVARTMQHALMGLIDSWLLTPDAFDLRTTAMEAMDLILHGAGVASLEGCQAPAGGGTPAASP